MLIKNKIKILVTGGNGRFSKILKEKNESLNLTFANKKECNILDLKSTPYSEYIYGFTFLSGLFLEYKVAFFKISFFNSATKSLFFSETTH